MAMVASDLNNPEFVGATNPDARLVVKFYSRPVEQSFASASEGRPIFRDMDYVTIFVPGDSNSVHDTPVREDHKKRFPLQWAHYQNKHGGDPREIGTPLAQWPRLTPAQAEELRALKFYTVESIANASDANIQRIGMAAGMSPYAFRDHALRFLSLAQGDSVAAAEQAKASAAEAELAEVKAENAKLREDMKKQMEEVQAMIASLKEAEPEHRKPGRPRKAA